MVLGTTDLWEFGRGSGGEICGERLRVGLATPTLLVQNAMIAAQGAET